MNDIKKQKDFVKSHRFKESRSFRGSFFVQKGGKNNESACKH